MATLRDIRRRITSVEKTQQITSAMRMVAAAKLRRAQDAIIAARPYSQRMYATLEEIGKRALEAEHPLLEQREEPPNLVRKTADQLRQRIGARRLPGVALELGYHFSDLFGVELTREELRAATLAGNANNDWEVTRRLLAGLVTPAPGFSSVVSTRVPAPARPPAPCSIWTAPPATRSRSAPCSPFTYCQPSSSLARSWLSCTTCA